MASMKATIAVLPGDGIGPEVVAEGVRVLQRDRATLRPRVRTDRSPVRRRCHRSAPASRCPPRRSSLPARRCRAAGRDRRTEMVRAGCQGATRDRVCCGLRQELGRLRQPAAGDASTRRCAAPRRSSPEILEGVDLMFVRELTGGIYFGAKTRDADHAPATCAATASPRSNASCGWRRGWPGRGAASCTSIDKSNVLETSRLWREVCERVVQPRISRCPARAHAGGFRGDAPDPPARAISMCRDREHVRRHPHR